MNSNDPHIIQSDAGLVADVRSMIEQTREGVARTLNAGMTLLCWRIGKRIQTEVLGNQRAEYGKEIVSTLSGQLSGEFGNGFSAKNLRHMMKFADTFPEPQILQALSAQFGWTHRHPAKSCNRNSTPPSRFHGHGWSQRQSINPPAAALAKVQARIWTWH